MWDLYNADLSKWLEDYNGEKYHALISDPPYNLDSIKKRFGKKDSAPAKFGKDGVFARSSRGFMGKEWDTDIAFNPYWWWLISEKVLLPGAIGMAFSSTRTFHRMASAIEDAGFIVHPMIGWIQGQGFPKATHVKNSEIFDDYRYGLQALKPSFEPICVFQKPHEGNQLDGILELGTGAFNIEGSRVGYDEIPSNVLEEWSGFGQLERPNYTQSKHLGRWPANVVITGDINLWYDKFFYCVKPNRKEKDAGLDALETVNYGQSGGALSKISQGEDEYLQDSIGLNRIQQVKNPHPTVKPMELIKWLATLLLPPVDYQPRRVFVPYSGSGSEIIGALLAGWDYALGIEIEEESCKIAVKRLQHWIK